MITEVNEAVKVGAVFSAGKIKICWLVWNGKKIPVDKTTFVWKTNRGAKNIRHFALASGREIFEIAFSTSELTWQLEKIHLP